VSFATEHHGGQARKGTTIPYIVHPLNVCKHLLRYGAGDDLASAGVLHDVLEDTQATYSQVEELFGERVALLVYHAGEPDKSADWQTRKEHTVQAVRKSEDLELLALKCADKLDNLSDIRFDFQMLGDDLWLRFNTPNGVSDQKWYYSTLSSTFVEKLEGSRWEPLAVGLDRLVYEVF